MSEKYEALLTAGLILAGLGVYFLTIPAGVVFGAVLLVVGVITFAVVLRRAIPTWRAARRERDASPREWDPEVFWNPERLLQSSLGVGAGWVIGGLLQSISSQEPAWWPIGFGAVWMLLAGTSLAALVWRRRRAS